MQYIYMYCKLHFSGTVVSAADVEVPVVHCLVPGDALLPVLSVALHKHHVGQGIEEEHGNR